MINATYFVKIMSNTFLFYALTCFLHTSFTTSSWKGFHWLALVTKKMVIRKLIVSSLRSKNSTVDFIEYLQILGRYLLRLSINKHKYLPTTIVLEIKLAFWSLVRKGSERMTGLMVLVGENDWAMWNVKKTLEFRRTILDYGTYKYMI